MCIPENQSTAVDRFFKQIDFKESILWASLLFSITYSRSSFDGLGSFLSPKSSVCCLLLLETLPRTGS